MRYKKTMEAIPVPNPNIFDHAYFVHVLLALMTGQWHPTQDQQEELITHLNECVACQKMLTKWLHEERDYDRKHDGESAILQELLSQLEQTLHNTQVHTEIGAYIDRLFEQGEEAANLQFPQFARHLRTCKAYRSDVEETWALLRLLEQNDAAP